MQSHPAIDWLVTRLGQAPSVERVVPANVQAQRELLGSLTRSDLARLGEIGDRIAATARALRGPRR